MQSSSSTLTATSCNTALQMEKCSPLLQSELETCNAELEQIWEHYGNHPKLANTLSTLGLFHQHMLHDYVKALMFHCEALRILAKQTMMGNTFHRSACLEASVVILTDVALIYQARDDKERALYTFRRALNLMKQLELPGNDPRVYSVKQGINRLCRCTSPARQECYCYRGDGSSSKRLEDDMGVARLLQQGEEYLAQDKYDEACNSFRQAATMQPDLALQYYNMVPL